MPLNTVIFKSDQRRSIKLSVCLLRRVRGRWGQHGPPKRRYPTTTLHGVRIQKTTTFNLSYRAHRKRCRGLGAVLLADESNELVRRVKRNKTRMFAV